MSAKIHTTDPVCGMSVTTATAVAHVEFEGISYHFCSHHCARVFSVDPAKFRRHPAPPSPYRFQSVKSGPTPGEPEEHG